MFLAKLGQGAVAAALLLCAGCVELGGSTAPSRFYALVPLAEARERPGQLGLGLASVRTPAYLDRPQIVTRRGADRLEVADFDRWAEPLDQAVSRVMALNLARLLDSQRVQRQPFRDPGAVELVVEIDLLRFEGDWDAGVTLEAFFGLRGEGLSLRRFAHVEEPIAGRDHAALAEAMSRALATFARQIADALPAVGAAVP